jgi:hypothetical protein
MKCPGPLLSEPSGQRPNPIFERYRVGSVRRELLDRILIANAAHLRKVLVEYEDHFNAHRPHRALNQASPLRQLPDPIDADIKAIRRDRLGGLSHEYSQVAQGGRIFGTDTVPDGPEHIRLQRCRAVDGLINEYRAAA